MSLKKLQGTKDVRRRITEETTYVITLDITYVTSHAITLDTTLDTT